jgi:hypothetical protein
VIEAAEADIVSVTGIGPSRVTQTDYQLHLNSLLHKQPGILTAIAGAAWALLCHPMCLPPSLRVILTYPGDVLLILHGLHVLL